MAIRSAPPRTSTPAPATSLIGKGWAQGVALVMIFGFLVMGILVYRTYTASMPLPAKVVSESGQVLFTGAQITRGQELYQARGLMQYGSVLGHGAYLGPDYTAEYLRMSTNDVAAQWRAQGAADAKERVVAEFRTNRFNADTKALVFTDKQTAAFDRIQQHYAEYFGENSTKYGLLPRMITSKADIHDLTAFSRGRRGRRRPSGRVTATATPTTGRPSRGSTTGPPHRSWCGRCCRWSRCSAGPASCSPCTGDGARRSDGTAPRRPRCRSASPARSA